METQKWIYRITGILTVLSLGGAIWVHFYGLDFLVNILLGIFASSFLVAVSSIVSYILLREKTKAQIQYNFRQIQHIIGQYKLYLQLTKSQLPYDIKKLSDVLLHAYSISFELNKIWVDLSIGEANSISATTLYRIISIRERISTFALAINEKPADWNALILGQIDFIDCANREINEFLKVSKFIGKQKEVATDD